MPAGNRRTAYYGRLSPGAYAFEVMAANNDGVWNTTPDTRRHLYLAFKAAVTNAVKHAQASEVASRWASTNGALVLEVADDGRGLPLEAIDPTGNGLRNRRERMEAAGGRLEVETAPARGTRLVFRTPL